MKRKEIEGVVSARTRVRERQRPGMKGRNGDSTKPGRGGASRFDPPFDLVWQLGVVVGGR